MMNIAAIWSDGPWSPVEVRAELPAPPEEVYEVLADPSTYPRWLIGAQRIRCADPAFPEPGAGFEHSVGPAENVTVDDRTEALYADPPHRLDLEVHAGLFHADVDIELEPGPGHTSLISFREVPTGPLAVFTPLLRPVVYARNGRSLKKLADYLGTHRAA